MSSSQLKLSRSQMRAEPIRYIRVKKVPIRNTNKPLSQKEKKELRNR